jgi:CRISPR-associated protein Cst2
MANFLSLTIIFRGANLNYGEGVGTVISLKRFSFKGKSYSYISRQALRYDIVRIMNHEFGIPLTPVDSSQNVVQFSKDATVDKYPEIDLFGYMKTEGGSRGKIRKAIVRLSDAISLEPWNGDIDYGTNMGLASRINADNSIFQTEIHNSFYTYTITVDLDKVGIDENDKINIPNEKKIERIFILLETLKTLYRDIKGRREDLSPVFIIGGVYNSGNPFFYNKIELIPTRESLKINTKIINDILNKDFNGKKVKDNTYIGKVEGIFSNINEVELPSERILSVNDFFKKIKELVKDVYK